MVIDGHREFLLRGLLPNYILIQILLQLQRFRKFMGRAVGVFLTVVFQDGIAYGDAFVADVSSWVITGGGYELTNYVLTLMTKRTA